MTDKNWREMSIEERNAILDQWAKSLAKDKDPEFFALIRAKLEELFKDIP